ncbi:hypothetical protein GCM10009540_20870 [Streptomyces turgidiscabies]
MGEGEGGTGGALEALLVSGSADRATAVAIPRCVELIPVRDSSQKRISARCDTVGRRCVELLRREGHFRPGALRRGGSRRAGFDRERTGGVGVARLCGADAEGDRWESPGAG